MRYLKRKIVENAGDPQGFWGKRTMRRMNKGHHELTDWGLSFLTVNGEDKALDIGCGGGRTVKKLSYATSNTVWGVDASRTAVNEAFRTNAKAIKNGKVMIVEASVSDLPFADNSFDVVTAVETIYFWPNLESDLKEVFRVMKPNGRLMLLTEDRADAPRPMEWTELSALIDLRLPDADSLAVMLQKAGFTGVTAHVKGNALCVIATTAPPASAKG